jgi:hypothetical protein
VNVINRALTLGSTSHYRISFANSILELHAASAQRISNPILQSIGTSPAIRLRRHRGRRLKSLGSHPSTRLSHEHPRPSLLYRPPRHGNRLLRTPKPLCPGRQLTPIARFRRLLRRRPRRQAIHGQLVYQPRRQPSLHGTRRENKPPASRP